MNSIYIKPLYVWDQLLLNICLNDVVGGDVLKARQTTHGGRFQGNSEIIKHSILYVLEYYLWLHHALNCVVK